MACIRSPVGLLVASPAGDRNILEATPMPKAELGLVLMTPGGTVDRDTAVSTDAMVWGDPVSVALCLWLQGLSSAQPRLRGNQPHGKRWRAA